MSKALIVVDMQNDFLTGVLSNYEAIRIIPKIKELIESGEYSWVVFTQDTHYDNYLQTSEGKALPVPHCIVESWGWEISEEFDEIFENDEIATSVICKPRFGSLQIAEHLEGLDIFDEVTFCGTCTDICVISNALILKAMRPELTINVKADCCAGLNPDAHNAALTVMRNCQINII